ncbi:MAG: aspartate aminotransferase family protein [Pseudomonadota bacterium]
MSSVLPTYARYDLEFTHGEGAYLYAASGRRYLDFGSGIAVNALGHAAPELIAALTAQAHKLWHTSNLYRIADQERLADRLCAATFADRVFFTNSGAEAMECAIKAGRRYHHVNGNPERYRFITINGAFHGRTLATIAAANKPKLVDGFGPMPDGFDQVDPGDHDALRAAITPQTAGIMVEPVQGEGGILPVPAQCMRGLRDLCDAHGILLILDEVQCGVGRTGKLYAHELSGIKPDIMATAKGIGGGFPLGACLFTAEAAKGMTTGTHGTTYGGNPLAMAVGNAMLDAVLEPGFLDDVRRKAGLFNQLLGPVLDAHSDVVSGVRGEGLMLGLQCIAPNGQLLNRFVDAGLLAVPAADNVIRLLPPLNITDAQLRSAVEHIETGLTAYKQANSNG